jgi:hypothetical protein
MQRYNQADEIVGVIGSTFGGLREYQRIRNSFVAEASGNVILQCIIPMTCLSCLYSVFFRTAASFNNDI